jgi:SAM-dependent methyltransferase
VTAQGTVDGLTADEATLPWPGEELVLRVTGGTSRENFYASGRQSVADINAALAVVGGRLDAYSSVLDFGCGCGRILLWLGGLPEDCVLHGADIDERAVRWAEANIPWAEVKVNQPLPPLDYPDGHFDLVFNHSVFTHLDEAYQDQWLAELRRVTRPGGHLLLTVHGEPAFAEYETNVARAGGDASWVREALGRDGIVFLKEDPFVGGPFPDFYHSTFHAPWYVFAHWGRFFTVRAYLPRRSLDFQDFVLLERTADGVGVKDAPPPIQMNPAPSGEASAAGGGEIAAPSALDESAPSAVAGRARALVEQGPDIGSKTRWGGAAVFARRTVNRVLRHHDEHQNNILAALADAVGELDRKLDARTLSGATKLTELNARLWDVVARQGDRVNRLEVDLSAELRALRSRLDEIHGESEGS